MSEMALDLIRKAKAERWKRLDLGRCGIVGVVPDAIGDLEDLEELTLSDAWWDWQSGERIHCISNGNENRITHLPAKLPPRLTVLSADETQIEDIGPLAAMQSLRVLRLRGTKVSDLSALSGLDSLLKVDVHDTQVANLAPLANATRLQKLYLQHTLVSDLLPIRNAQQLVSLHLDGTKVSDLSPLSGFTMLTTLGLEFTDVADLGPLAGLTTLEKLDLQNTKVTDLKPLAGLLNLKALYLQNTGVHDVGPLSELKMLNKLYLQHTSVSDLRPLRHMIERVDAVELRQEYGFGLLLAGCPLLNPPLEFVRKGKNAMLDFWKQSEVHDTIPIYETKLLVLGEPGVGKTTLVRRMFFPNEGMTRPDEGTMGIQVRRFDYPTTDGNTMTINIWDFGKQEIYFSTHQFFLSKRSIYVLVDDTSEEETEFEGSVIKSWLETISLLGGDSPVLIFQSEKDWKQKVLPKDAIRRQFPNVHPEFFAGNLADPGAAAPLLQAIKEIALKLPHVGEPWLPEWWKIRQELEELQKTQPYISFSRYQEIYRKQFQGPVDAQFEEAELQLCNYLNDLGVILRLEPNDIFDDLIFLDKQWGRNAVNDFFHDDQVKAAHGYFTLADCNRIWRLPQYQGQSRVLLQLMMRFELCYELRDQATSTWLATPLLAAAPPAQGFEQLPGDLVLRYDYEALPIGMVARLMVRKNRYLLNHALAWRQGAVFEDHDSQVMVYIPTGKKEVCFRARGGAARDFLLKLSEELETLNDTFAFLKGKVRKIVPCNCKTCQSRLDPNAYSYDELIERRTYGKRTIECRFPPYTDVDIQVLLEGFNSQTIALTPPLDVETSGTQKRIFISYSSADEEFCKQMEKHLKVQERQQSLVVWDMHQIMPSQEWEPEVNRELEAADIIVVLLSADFFASDFIWEKEYKTAITRRDAGLCQLAGIVLRPCDWQSTALGKVQMLRKGAEIGEPGNDAAWTEVVRELKAMVGS